MAWRPDYATTAQVKHFLGIDVDDTTDDDEIATAITAASRAIDRSTGRQFGKVDGMQLRSYEAQWDRHRRRWVVSIDDLAGIAGLLVLVGDDEVTNFQLEPVNAISKGGIYTALAFLPSAEAFPTHHDPRVTLTSDLWGWDAFPTTIINACKLQTGRFHKRRDALFGVAGSPADGSEVRLLAKVDPDVQVMLCDYVRRWGAV